MRNFNQNWDGVVRKNTVSESPKIKWIPKKFPPVPDNGFFFQILADGWVSDPARFTIRKAQRKTPKGWHDVYLLYDAMGHMMPGAKYDSQKYANTGPRNTGSAYTLDAIKKQAENDLRL